MRRVCARFRRRNRGSSWPSESFGIANAGMGLECFLVIASSVCVFTALYHPWVQGPWKKPFRGKVQRQDFSTSLENPATAAGFSLFPPPRLRRCDFPINPQKNVAPGAPRNDDLQLGRPLASPVCCFFRTSAGTAAPPASSTSRSSFLIAPPRQSSTLVADISPRKTHQILVPGGQLPWLAAELPGHDSAGSRGVDRHPGTTAPADDAQSR